MGIIEKLKEKNRTMLEMYEGLLFWGIVCQLVGMLFVEKQFLYAVALWFGIVLASVSILHMYQTLDRALDLGEAATKIIFKGYVIRYVALILILAIIMVTGVFNPLIVFLAYMGMKVTALIQPITHKLFNKVFHETDPIPEPLPEEVSTEEETPQE